MYLPLQGSYIGFAYAPADAESTVAWSVYRTQGLNVGENPIKLTFQVVRVNKGEAWNANTHNLTAPISGYYYVHIDSCAQAFQENYNRVNVDLLKIDNEGEHVVCGVRRTSLTHDESDGLSRGCVVHLNVGDILYLRANPWSGLWNDLDGQNVFSGFLVYSSDFNAKHSNKE